MRCRPYLPARVFIWGWSVVVSRLTPVETRNSGCAEQVHRHGRVLCQSQTYQITHCLPVHPPPLLLFFHRLIMRVQLAKMESLVVLDVRNNELVS